MTISTVTSEALQLKLRQLLPSQQGFGTDLSASDTIIPIIDLTEAAEGSDVGENLQTAICFGSATAFQAICAAATIANSPGFYRVTGVASIQSGSSANTLQIRSTDGASTKVFFEWASFASGPSSTNQHIFDFVVFLGTGESIDANSSSANAYLIGTSRQIADVNGTLVQPSGFTPS